MAPLRQAERLVRDIDGGATAVRGLPLLPDAVDQRLRRLAGLIADRRRYIDVVA
jgi:hypothetical protein